MNVIYDRIILDFLYIFCLVVDNENTSCNHLLYHPPFKPKRLIQLCADGSIQVLSAVDEKFNEKQTINQQHYDLNYSNSARKSMKQQLSDLSSKSFNIVTQY